MGWQERLTAARRAPATRRLTAPQIIIITREALCLFRRVAAGTLMMQVRDNAAQRTRVVIQVHINN